MQEWFKTFKLSFFFIFLLVFSSFTFALLDTEATSDVTSNGFNIGYPLINFIRLGSNYQFNFHVYNISDGKYIVDGINCSYHMYDSFGNHIFQDEKTSPSTDFDYTFDVNATYLSSLGNYFYRVQCTDGIIGGFAENDFEVTSDGSNSNLLNNDNKLNIYSFIICIVICFIFLILGFAIKEYAFVAVSSMLMVLIGGFIAINGLQGINNHITQAVALILLAIGLYIFIKGSLDKLYE